MDSGAERPQNDFKFNRYIHFMCLVSKMVARPTQNDFKFNRYIHSLCV